MQPSGGVIFKGHGPPLPTFGGVQLVYMDSDTGDVYQKRAEGGLDPWGFPLFNVPALNRAATRIWSTFPPAPDQGATGDYALYWDLCAPGLSPQLIGPKGVSSWPAPGPTFEGLVTLNPLAFAKAEHAIP